MPIEARGFHTRDFRHEQAGAGLLGMPLLSLERLTFVLARREPYHDLTPTADILTNGLP